MYSVSVECAVCELAELIKLHHAKPVPVLPSTCWLEGVSKERLRGSRCFSGVPGFARRWHLRHPLRQLENPHSAGSEQPCMRPHKSESATENRVVDAWSLRGTSLHHRDAATRQQILYLQSHPAACLHALMKPAVVGNATGPPRIRQATLSPRPPPSLLLWRGCMA